MGLIALTAVLMVPALGVVWTSPARLWSDARLAPAAVLALALLLWNIDDISNSMPNPLTPAAAGALVTFVLLMREPKKGTTTSGMVRPPSSPPASREAR
jgi:hypothetical protein